MLRFDPIRRLSGMRDACRIAAEVLDEMSKHLKPGLNTYDLDQIGRTLIEAHGASSACYNYRIGHRRFPAHTCLSVNEEIVHGIGSLRRVLRSGDTITIDVCVAYRGWIGDNARTFAIGQVRPEIDHLLRVTEEALYLGIAQARPKNRVGDVSHAIQKHVEAAGFSVVREFVGHGVGASMHEEPQIPNFGSPGRGFPLSEGMTLAIEPMVTLGRPGVEILADGWTAVTRDRQSAAHFEHTVLVTAEDPEILTVPKK